MVVDKNMYPVWCNTPESCRAWLRYRIKDDPSNVYGYMVRTGWPSKLVWVHEYLEMEE